ncbi:MAG TPA: sigma 54-interacting transcriptional regulator [Rhodocyclaceae bacterium]|nr:sigma 54-interacting transcriptional regulator [Rhodocyclaceae bacterium]HNA05128.1 sigma 54-interacting transcriptional regulator [Rhodocyclaceae bacterium]
MDNLAARLKFSFPTGHIWLGEERMILLHRAAFGSFRKELVSTLGMERARGVLTRMGFAAGGRDAELVRSLYPNASDAELIRNGPLLHTLEGIAKVEPIRIDVDIAKGHFFADVNWLHSFERGVHQQIFGIEDGSCCWMQVGYACGYISGIMRRFTLFEEVECGLEQCRIVGKPIDQWDEAQAEPLLRYFRADPVADQLLELQHQVETLRYSIDESTEPGDLIGKSAAFREAWGLLKKAAKSQVTVLLLGETGVGKEMFARALHKISSRSNAPFVAVNCGALPEQLLEAELFGVQQGAYTGAQQSRPGRFERAHGGTLFLDEVGELSPSAQTKLLRVLQEGELERLGDTRSRRIDVRVVAATNIDLDAAVRDGRFRRDLFYRLNVFPVTIAPLRERVEDIPLLVARFIDKYAAREGKRVRGVTDKAMEALCSHAWPGNVRELENVVERGVLLAPPDGQIDVVNLFAAAPSVVEEGADRGVDRRGNIAARKADPVERFIAHCAAEGLGLAEVEQLLVDAALARCDNNVSAAARELGMTRPQLRYRLKHGRREDG